MRVHVVDPSAYTPPYDAALCAALAKQGADVELVTSPFAYGQHPQARGYVVREDFYRYAVGRPASALRLASKLAEHVPDMLSYRRRAQAADVVHFQWLPIQWLDRYLLPRRPLVLTAHDLLPREPRRGQLAGQRRLYDAMDAIVVHSDFGRSQLVGRLGVAPDKVRVIHHGAFSHLADQPEAGLPPELPPPSGPVVLFFGLLRPYKGVAVLLEAWRSLGSARSPGSRAGAPDAELWVVGRPRMPIAPLQAAAGGRVRFVPRFVSDAELAACFRRADVVVLPYVETERIDFSGVLATALAFTKPVVVSDVGGFRELAATGAARLVPPADPKALAAALGELLTDRGARKRMELAAAAAVAGPYSWQQSARRTLMLYREIARSTR